jgi:hypothetical protein
VAFINDHEARRLCDEHGQMTSCGVDDQDRYGLSEPPHFTADDANLGRINAQVDLDGGEPLIG